MNQQLAYLLAADALLFLHVAFVVFVVVGLMLVIAGGVRGWRWVRNPWFRWAHLGAIGFVVAQAWLGRICPLTVWEMELRRQAGEAVYQGSFVAHWLDELLYYQAPAWVFIVLYSLFGACVLAGWYWVRPRSFGERITKADTGPGG